MKKLKEIKQMIDSAQEGLDEVLANAPFWSFDAYVEQKENLKNLLEGIRLDIEDFLDYSGSSIVSRVCKDFLESILGISENLGASYAFAGYNESYYILDTIRIAEDSYKKKR